MDLVFELYALLGWKSIGVYVSDSYSMNKCRSDVNNLKLFRSDAQEKLHSNYFIIPMNNLYKLLWNMWTALIKVWGPEGSKPCQKIFVGNGTWANSILSMELYKHFQLW